MATPKLVMSFREKFSDGLGMDGVIIIFEIFCVVVPVSFQPVQLCTCEDGREAIYDAAALCVRLRTASAIVLTSPTQSLASCPSSVLSFRFRSGVLITKDIYAAQTHRARKKATTKNTPEVGWSLHPFGALRSLGVKLVCLAAASCCDNLFDP